MANETIMSWKKKLKGLRRSSDEQLTVADLTGVAV